MRLLKLLKNLCCKHINTMTVTNIHSDAINYFNCRSIKVCKDCHRIIKSNTLDKECKIVNFELKEIK